MKKICKHCNTEFSGRSDKTFCTVKCKNEHNYARRQATSTNDIVKEIDGYLHRNREILAILMPEGNKIKFDRMVLNSFNFC